MNDCVICQHELRGHRPSRCGQRSPLRGACDCTYALLPPLAPDADARAHQERSDWWDRQARISGDLAMDARDDLDRWYFLMRFQRAARSSEIAERHAARTLSQVATSLAVVPTESQSKPAPAVEPTFVPALSFSAA